MTRVQCLPELPTSWKHALGQEGLLLWESINKALISEVHSHEVYPPMNDVFRALDVTPLHKVKVVLLGQDPYHQPGQAHGLAFSVPKWVPLPPSLRNIAKELMADIAISGIAHGDLTPWAMQGVLLLNSALTVRRNEPRSHQNIGWEAFTDKIISVVSSKNQHVVFLLWGNFARSKEKLIDREKHLILHAPHPSPLSAYSGFFGSKPFSQSNAFLLDHGAPPIDWSLDDF